MNGSPFDRLRANVDKQIIIGVKMTFYRVVILIVMLSITGFSDENVIDMNAKIQECKNEKNGKSCYDAGQYFSKNQEENSSNQTLYYYGQGCKYNYQESCVEEVDYAIQKHFFLKRFTRKIVSVGDLYFQQNEYKKAFEYYNIAAQYNDSEAFYKKSLTSIKSDSNISNAEKYYFQYIRSVISNIDFYSEHKILIRLRKTGTIELKFVLLQDGSIAELMITKPSQDDDLNKYVYISIQKLPKFYPIPFEFQKDKIIIVAPIVLRLS